VSSDINPGRCQFRIRPFPGFQIIGCDLFEHPDTVMHQGAIRDYAYPGSVTLLNWMHDDRRPCSGEFIECPARGCILPAGPPRGCEAA
jgi:hypothetical protein